MDRRQFLAVAGSTLLAGCPGGSPSETPTRTDPETPSPESTTPRGTDETPSRTSSPTDADPQTDSPTPESTANPPLTTTVESTPASLEPVQFSGRGNAARRVDIAGGLTVVDAEYVGSGSFSVTFSPVSEGHGRRFFDTSGPHRGASADLLDEGTYDVDVVAERTYWRLTVRQPRPTTGSSLPAYLDGSGSDVFGPYEFDGDGATVAASHTSDGSFLVEVWPLAGDFSTVVFDRTGRFASETSFEPPDVGFVEVTAGGDWTLGLRNG